LAHDSDGFIISGGESGREAPGACFPLLSRSPKIQKSALEFIMIRMVGDNKVGTSINSFLSSI